jgi:hypothetical protein
MKSLKGIGTPEAQRRVLKRSGAGALTIHFAAYFLQKINTSHVNIFLTPFWRHGNIKVVLF